MKNLLRFGKTVGKSVGNEVKAKAEDTFNEMRSTMTFTIKLYTYIGAGIGLAIFTLIGVGIYKLLS